MYPANCKWITYRSWLSNTALVLVLMLVFTKIGLPIDSYLSCGIWAVILTVSIVMLFLIMNSLLERDAAKTLFHLLKSRRTKSPNEELPE